ncbi:MAG: helix-turn-helix domain-containing protein [Marinobacterium sp.]|nr:helix-turn-helix domain-containing protein [Marinobacterium sp.]
MSTLKVQFGQQLRTLRRTQGITQESLANAAGLTTESISNIERGIFAPRFENIEKLAQALNVEVRVLFEFDADC